jgi:hypothetical protein
MVEKRRYVQVVVAWVLGAAAIPALFTYALGKAMESRCETGMTDCSWGLEVLIIIPVILLSLLTMGPLAMYLYLRRKGDPVAGATTGWALVCIPTLLPLLLLARVPGLVVWLPPLAGRWFALRRARQKAPATQG